MKRLAVLTVVLALAGCGKAPTVRHEVSAVLVTDLTTGTTTLTCRDSSSGSCHMLFVTGKETQRIGAEKGKSETATGITDQTQFCLQESAPQNGCRLQPIARGEQIIRSKSTHTE